MLDKYLFNFHVYTGRQKGEGQGKEPEMSINRSYK